ncbi:MAG: molybdopterin-dependent oxidoreductase [Chloroflexota bacterium]
MPPHDPLQPHSHDPNLITPEGDGSFSLLLPNDRKLTISVSDLMALAQTAVSDCYIVSTGHGTSGPFTFVGVTLRNFMDAFWAKSYASVEVVSVDGFGNRVTFDELQEETLRPILLTCQINGKTMTREEGLTRMIVPSETDDALRQVKWVGEIRVVN